MITYAVIDAIKETSEKDGTLDIYWEDNEKGFGHIYLHCSPDGTLQIDTEFMGKAFAKKVFDKLISDAEIEDTF